MKRKGLMLMMLVGLFLGGCSNQTSAVPQESEKPTSQPAQTEEAVVENTAQIEKTLVVYFSATGTTKRVAEMIAHIVDADLYEVIPEEPYSPDDLNWHDPNSRTSIEQNDANSRPEIASETRSIEEYTTIYIGYPIWWGIAPHIMDTFVEQYSFEGKTIIPFCTSGSSGIGNSGKNLEESAGSGNWLEGQRFGASVSEDDVKAWIAQ